MTKRLSLVLAFVLLAGSLAACSGGGTTGTDGAGAMPTLDGATLLEARCADVCHDTERIDAKDLDFANWLPVLDTMIANGAKLSPEEKTVLADFLAND